MKLETLQKLAAQRVKELAPQNGAKFSVVVIYDGTRRGEVVVRKEGTGPFNDDEIVDRVIGKADDVN